MKREGTRFLAIIVLLTVAILGPSLLAGWHDVQLAVHADSEGRHADASLLFERAARLLPWRTDLWEAAGLAASESGQTVDAIRLLQLAGDRSRLSLDGSVALGSALWDQGQAAQAVAAWQDGLQIHPDQPALLERLAAAYDHEGDYSGEQAMLLRRLAVADDATAHYRLGLLLMLSGSEGAAAHFQAAGSLDPRYTDAATTLEAALLAAGRESTAAGQMVVIGRGLGLVGEWTLAGQAFAKAIASDPNAPEAWAWLGESQQHNGQDGSQALNQALSLGPHNVVVHSLRALYWRRQGDYAAALQEQLQAAQLDPLNPGMQAALGDAYAAAGNLVSAMQAYQRATQLAPDDPSIWRRLAAFCVGSGVQMKEIGLPAAMKAASLAPHDGQTLDVLGWTLALSGSPESGRQTLLEAVKAQPGLPLIHVHLAETYLQLGDYGSAAGELQTAVKLDPSGPAGQLAAQLLSQYFP